MARAEESRGLRDEANVGPDPRRARELRPLKDLRWKVADGEPDIRGWPVYASTGRELGVVEDLMIDTEAGEVVMLDVDLKRDDRHTLAPLRAAWIDRKTKRVVVDARELGADDALPSLARSGTLSDAEVSRFDDDYRRAYGDRAHDEHDYRLRRGDDELRFGARRDTPRRLLNESTSLGATGAAAMGAAAVGGAHAFDESDRINRELADLPRDRSVSREPDVQRRDAERRDAELSAAVTDDAARRERETRERESRDREVRADTSDDPMLAEREIDPRELDARVRIDEGATVDESTPVAGVRYDTPNYPHHGGRLEDRAVELDRDVDDRIVSRRPWVEDEASRSNATADREIRYGRRAGDSPPE